MPPSISLIITIYNRAHTLPATIESVLAQTHPYFELLLWDDGSSDDSVAVARHYALKDDRIRVVAAAHQGIAPSLKSAIAATTGIYLGWVDSDDLLAPTAIAETVAILNNHPDVGMVYTNYEVIDAQGQNHGLGQRCRIPYSPERLLVDFMTFHFRLLRRTVYDQVGGIDATFERAEDYDLCLKLAEVTQIHHLEQPLYRYRQHANNVTNEPLEMIRWSHKASTQALHRRGLSDRYTLDLKVVSTFTLRQKPAVVTAGTALAPCPANAVPKVSIILPTYNRKVYLRRALDSILCQTFKDYEIIVIDDGSSDGTAAWLPTAYPQVRFLPLPTNQGAAAARNSGIKTARGTFIAFLDSDDEWLPEYLHHQIQALEAQPTAVLAYCNHIRMVAGQAQGRPVVSRPSHDDLIVSLLLDNFLYTLSQVVVPATVFTTVGWFNERFKGCHDYEFYLRLFAAGTPVHVPHYLIRKFWLPDSIVTQSDCQQWLANGLKLFELFYRHPDNARYLPLRPTVEQAFRTRVAGARQFFAQAFGRPPVALTEPLVTIIIPCYNAAASITACLESCRQQTYRHLEIIVVDNNSTDHTADVVQQWAKAASVPVQLLHCQPQGANHARNLGFTAASGAYIQWLDADDELHPDSIAAQVAALEAQPTIDIAYSDWAWHFYQEQQLTAQFTFPGKPYDDFLLQLLLDNWRPPHAYLLRRTAAERLQQSNGWNPHTAICMDREYFTLAALLGLRFLYVPGTPVRYYRWSAQQLTRSTRYSDRVESRRQMFQRFQDIAQARTDPTFNRVHWFLLQQNWAVWQPAFTLLPTGSESVTLQFRQGGQPVVLHGREARLAQALFQSSAPRTLEDHARHVVRDLWCEVLNRISHSHPTQLANFALLEATLSQMLGLTHEPIVPIATESAPCLPPLDPTMLPPLLQDVPLFAPLFGEQRLVVQGVLTRWCQQGWLESSVAPAAPERLALQHQQPREGNPWALAPTALAWLATFIASHHIQSVVEVGSGQSTLLLAALQRDGVIQRSLSLEHDHHWYNDVRQRLQQQALLPYSQVQLCPLAPLAWQGAVTPWYDIQHLAAFPADLVLVDGPPGHGNLLTRQPALQHLQPFLKAGTWIVLDDYQRPAEQATVQRWLHALPTLKLVEHVPIDTGLAVLQFHQA